MFSLAKQTNLQSKVPCRISQFRMHTQLSFNSFRVSFDPLRTTSVVLLFKSNENNEITLEIIKGQENSIVPNLPQYITNKCM